MKFRDKPRVIRDWIIEMNSQEYEDFRSFINGVRLTICVDNPPASIDKKWIEDYADKVYREMP